MNKKYTDMKRVRILNIYTLLLFILGIIGFISCSDDDKNGGQPEIYNVRLTDPTKTDSTFTDAWPGQMVVVIGRNLEGIKKIFINEQEVSFNTNYNTSTSIIITIPKDLILTGTDPELQGEIRIETNHGNATYRFHIYSPAPSITRISLKYPAIAGNKLLIYGTNFYEIQKIVFEGENGKNVEVSDYTVSKAFDQIELTIPSGIENGLLTVYCYTDKASIEFTTSVAPPTIKSFSSDMPIPGTLAYVTGANYIDVTNININGEFNIPGADLTVSESNDTIYFTLPQMPTKNGVVTITAAGGNSISTKQFYPTDNVILNWDNVGWYSWGDNNQAVTADGSNPPYVSTGVCYRIFGKPGAWQFWWGNVVNGCAFPSTSVIPGNTSINNLRLRFEFYATNPVAPAAFDITLKGKLLENYQPIDMNIKALALNQWITCEIPLSLFTEVTDYSTFLGINNTELSINTKNRSDNGDVVINAFFDNFRIIDVTK